MMYDQLPVVKSGTLNFESINTTVGIVTPEVAAQLLERNFAQNRNVGQTVVRRYSRLMKSGLWGLSDPLKFASNGNLIDGQHRLSAVINSGASVPFVIITGYPQESAELLDQGKKRDASNIMQMRGLVSNSTAISIIRMVVNILNPNNRFNLSTSEVVNLVETYDEGLQFACRYQHTKPTGIRYAPVFTAVFLAYYEENHDRLDDFLYCWHNGTVRRGIEDNAALLLRTNYQQNITHGGMSERQVFFGKAQSALSYFLKGECPKHFKEVKKLLWGKSFTNEKLLAQAKEFKPNQK